MFEGDFAEICARNLLLGLSDHAKHSQTGSEDPHQCDRKFVHYFESREIPDDQSIPLGFFFQKRLSFLSPLLLFNSSV